MKMARDAATILVLLTLFISVRVTPPEPIEGLVPEAEAATGALPMPAAAMPAAAVPLRPVLHELRLDRVGEATGSVSRCPRLKIERVNHGGTRSVTIEVDRRVRHDGSAGCDNETICLPLPLRSDC